MKKQKKRVKMSKIKVTVRNADRPSSKVTVRKVGKVTYRLHKKGAAKLKPSKSLQMQIRQNKQVLGRINAQVNEQSKNLLNLTRSIEERNSTLKNLGDLLKQTTEKTTKLVTDYGTLRGRAIGLAAQLVEVADSLREAADINDLTLTQITAELLLTDELDPILRLQQANEAELDDENEDALTSAITEMGASGNVVMSHLEPESTDDDLASYFAEEPPASEEVSKFIAVTE
jgi:hypothetical protein